MPLTVPPASTAVCENPPAGPSFPLPADFVDADAGRAFSFMYDASGVLINATVMKSDPSEGPWKVDAKLSRAAGGWSIVSTISYVQSVGCFGKGATRSVYVVVYYGTVGAKLGIDWEMPPRLSKALENGWGSNSYGLPRPAYADPDSWKVKLFLTNKGVPDCPAGATYTWHVTGNGFSADVPGTGCSVVADVPHLGVYDVTATNSTAGVVAENKKVVVRDWVIVGLGDSNGSGEGNPPWQFAQCDRSLASSQYQVAQYIEDHDPRSSVTLLFTSCSGATVEHLWRFNYDGTKPDLGPPLLPQMKQVVRRLGFRSVDAVVMSVGINNLRFGPLMAYCIGGLLAYRECESERVAATVDKNGYVLSYAQGAPPDPTLANATRAKLRTLPSSYSALARQFQAQFDFRRAHIFITEYPDFAHDENGKLCTGSSGPLPHFYPGTWIWLDGLNDVLNQRVARTSEYGWKLVGGIADEFERHGYCSTRSYFRTIVESLLLHSDVDGSLHPTPAGQQVTYEHTLDDVCIALYGNPVCDGIPPWRP